MPREHSYCISAIVIHRLFFPPYHLPQSQRVREKQLWFPLHSLLSPTLSLNFLPPTSPSVRNPLTVQRRSKLGAVLVLLLLLPHLRYHAAEFFTGLSLWLLQLLFFSRQIQVSGKPNNQLYFISLSNISCTKTKNPSFLYSSISYLLLPFAYWWGFAY